MTEKRSSDIVVDQTYFFQEKVEFFGEKLGFA